jgi:hypothetical protein
MDVAETVTVQLRALRDLSQAQVVMGNQLLATMRRVSDMESMLAKPTAEVITGEPS